MAAAASPGRHRARNILFGIAACLLIAFALCEVLGWRFLRQPAQTLISRELERPVRISEPFRLHLLGGIKLAVGGLWIAAPEALAIPYFLDARDIEIRLRYGDLWAFRQSGELRIAGIDVDSIAARLRRDARGNASWQFGKGEAGKAPHPPVVERLKVRQGNATFNDPFTQADLEVNFDTQEGAANQAPISHAQARGKFRQLPFSAQLTSSGWLPVTGGEAVAANGWLDYGGVRGNFDGELKDIFAKPAIKGSVAIRGSSLGLVGRLIDKPLPTTPAFSLQGNIAGTEKEWRFDIDNARVGDSRLAGRFTFDPATSPPRVEGELRGAHFVLADLAPAFGTHNDFGKPIAPPPGRTIPDVPLNLPSLKKLDARIAVNLEHVDLGKAFAEPIAPLKAELRLEDGKMTLADITAQTAKGRLNGMISVDANPAVPYWRSDLAWDGIRLEDWLKTPRKTSPKQGRARNTDPTPYFTGSLHGRARLDGSGRTTAKLVGSLNGEITTFVRDGSLSRLVVELLGLDVAQSLGLVLTGDQELPVQCAVVDLQAKDGLLTPRVALIDTPVTLVLAGGKVDLGRESLNLRVTARPKNISPLTLRSPIDIGGSFQRPTATPEPGPIAARILGGAALAAANPLAAIIPFIDPGDSPQSPCRRSLAGLRH